MNAKTPAVVLLLLLGLVATVQAQTETRAMSLEECLIRGMEKNLGLQVQVLQTRIADTNVTRASEKFLPVLSFTSNTQRLRNTSYSYLDASDEIRTTYTDTAGRLAQNLPGGGSLQIDLDAYMNDSNRSFQTINPRFGGTLSLQMTQPLLKDFGFRVARREILIARNDRDASEIGSRKAVIDTLFEIEQAYWNLVFARGDLDVKRRSLQLARDLLEQNRRKLAIGMIAPIEIVSAESETAQREVEILQAEVLAKNAEDTLRTLLDIREAGVVLQPAEQPTTEPRPTSLESAQALALASRPEIQTARIDVKSRDLDLVYARNQLLPDLSLQASYWSPGLSGTQILYQDGNPLSGIILGTIASGAGAAMSDAFRLKSPNWSVSLNFSLPLSSVVSRAAAASAKLGVSQARIALENREQSVLLEVRNAVRQVEADFLRLAATKAALTLAERKLEAEEKKVQAGLSTNYILLQVQRDLAAARSQELRARVDYTLSLARLDQATGTTLERRGIKWTSPLDGSAPTP